MLEIHLSGKCLELLDNVLLKKYFTCLALLKIVGLEMDLKHFCLRSTDHFCLMRYLRIAVALRFFKRVEGNYEEVKI